MCLKDNPELIELPAVSPRPLPGAVEETRTPVFLLWSQCMRTDVGSVVLQPGNIELSVSDPSTRVRGAEELGDAYIDRVIGRENHEADPARYWNIAFDLELDTPLDSGVTYTVTLRDDWRDCDDGSPPLRDSLRSWSFAAVERPRLLSWTPAFGATDVVAGSVTEVCLDFDGPMNVEDATLTILRGPGSLLAPAEASPDARSFCFAVDPADPLQEETSYEMRAQGFRAVSGLEAAYGPGPAWTGVLRFETLPDRER